MALTCTHGSCLTRRSVLAAGGAVGVATLAACSSGGGEGEATTTAEAPAPGSPIATVSDVPVGGALAATTSAGEAILLTQPTDGQIKAFSSVCTHQGCAVEPGDGELACPCHGSVFDLATGAPVQGPATDPLSEVTVEVADNGDITG